MKINAVYKISDQPLIYASTGPKAWSQLPAVEKREGYMLCHPMWQFSWTSLRLYARLRKMLKQKNIHLILLHNSAAEYRFAKRFGFHSYFINQNIHACEHDFVVQPEPKKYDAVYIAAAKPYKRIHLAADIERLYVVTYFWPDVRDENGHWDLHQFEPRVAHADFNRDRIDAQQISRIINASHCGLALSKKEGAMWATMEYLLSGLPIVSTPSVGGRDFFFDPEYVKVVPPDPPTIRQGVETLMRMELDPNEIRVRTLEKMQSVRKRYFELCHDLHNQSSLSSQKLDYEWFWNHIWGGTGISKLRIL